MLSDICCVLGTVLAHFTFETLQGLAPCTFPGYMRRDLNRIVLLQGGPTQGRWHLKYQHAAGYPSPVSSGVGTETGKVVPVPPFLSLLQSKLLRVSNSEWKVEKGSLVAMG